MSSPSRNTGSTAVAPPPQNIRPSAVPKARAPPPTRLMKRPASGAGTSSDSQRRAASPHSTPKPGSSKVTGTETTSHEAPSRNARPVKTVQKGKKAVRGRGRPARAHGKSKGVVKKGAARKPGQNKKKLNNDKKRPNKK